ncbi:MAG: AAA family ATPase [Succinivibrio sp.]
MLLIDEAKGIIIQKEMKDDKKTLDHLKYLHRSLYLPNKGVVSIALTKRNRLGSSISLYIYNDIDNFSYKTECVLSELTPRSVLEKIRNISSKQEFLSISAIIKSLFIIDRNCKFGIKLSKEQNNIIKSDKKRQRVLGAPGSGKTSVATIKVARYLALGKRVLFTAYNITMMNHIRELLNRALSQPSILELDVTNIDDQVLKNCVVMHYHEFLNIVSYKHSLKWNSDCDLDEDTYKRIIEKLKQYSPSKKYDLIVVDEAQDFKPNWLTLLSCYLEKDGTMLVLADPNQDVYKHASKWASDLFSGLGFHGPWINLKTTYRLPKVVANLCSKFALEFLTTSQDNTEYGLLPSKEGVQSSLNLIDVQWYQRSLPEELMKLMNMIHSLYQHIMENAC